MTDSEQRRAKLKAYCANVLSWTQIHGNPVAVQLESTWLKVEMGFIVRLSLEPFPSAIDIKAHLGRVRGYLEAVRESEIASPEELSAINRASNALIDIE